MKVYKVLNTDDDFSLARSVVYREIKRSNLNRIILALLLLAAFVWLDVVATVFRAKLYYQGPQEISLSELLDINDARTQLTDFGFNANREESDEYDADPGLHNLMYKKNGSCYVSVKPLGFIPLEIEDDEEIVYELADLGGRYMLVKRSALVKLDMLSGTIGYLPSDIKQIALDYSDVPQAELAPLFMDATAQIFDNVPNFIAFDALIILIWGLWFFFILRRTFNIEKNPAYKRIFICPGPVEDNIRQIDRELASGDCYTVRGVTVTKNWSLRRRLLSFELEHADQP